jgi:uncharacterized protein YbbC (DUF1343 family)
LKLISTVIAIAAAMTTHTAVARVYSGLELFLAKHTNLVKGKRVGLLTNPTGVDANLQSTADLLKRNPDVNLVALFAPEHGIRGDHKAGDTVSGSVDAKTGLPVYSLYGRNGHKPSKEALSKIDVLIYDIQDVGSRAYTYIWHLAECMKAAALANKTIIVLDRPDVFGGMVVDGPVTEKKHLSFIGLYPIPRVYGMTVGELARYLNHEEEIGCSLKIVPMLNYRRGTPWKRTGLPWVPTSPHVPTPDAACCFAATGTLGETGVLNIGIGYTIPFQAVAAPWIDAERTTAALNALKLPGVRFRPIHYKPFYGAYAKQMVHGVQIHVIDPARFLPATTETAILCHLQKHYPGPGRFHWRSDKTATFDKAMGTDTVRRRVAAGWSYQAIVKAWRRDLLIFKAKRAKYLIYR